MLQVHWPVNIHCFSFVHIKFLYLTLSLSCALNDILPFSFFIIFETVFLESVHLLEPELLTRSALTKTAYPTSRSAPPFHLKDGALWSEP